MFVLCILIVYCDIDWFELFWVCFCILFYIVCSFKFLSVCLVRVSLRRFRIFCIVLWIFLCILCLYWLLCGCFYILWCELCVLYCSLMFVCVCVIYLWCYWWWDVMFFFVLKCVWWWLFLLFYCCLWVCLSVFWCCLWVWCLVCCCCVVDVMVWCVDVLWGDVDDCLVCWLMLCFIVSWDMLMCDDVDDVDDVFVNVWLLWRENLWRRIGVCCWRVMMCDCEWCGVLIEMIWDWWY